MSREKILGFGECNGHSAEQLLLFFKKNNLNLDQPRPQGYDGATNMNRIYKGLQVKISNK